MFINNHNNYNKKDIVIIPKKIYNNENSIKSLNKIDIKQNDKSYENIKNIVRENSKKQFSFFFF